MTLQILEDAHLKRVSRILGPSCAAAKALAEANRRRAAGEDVVVFENLATRMIVVGPRLESDAAAPSRVGHSS